MKIYHLVPSDKFSCGLILTQSPEVEGVGIEPRNFITHSSSAVDYSLIHVLSLWYHVKITDGPPTIVFSMVSARSLFASSKSANRLKLGKKNPLLNKSSLSTPGIPIVVLKRSIF